MSTVFTKFSLSVYNKLEQGAAQQIGQCIFDVAEIDLELNRAKCHMLTVHEKDTDQDITILLEVTFLHNGFIENPVGIVQVEVQKIELNPVVDIVVDYLLSDKELPRCFDQHGHSFQMPCDNIEIQVPFNLYTHRKITEYLKNPAALSLLESEATNWLRFAELHWAQNKEDLKEYQATTKLALPSKKSSVQVNLKLTFRNEK